MKEGDKEEKRKWKEKKMTRKRPVHRYNVCGMGYYSFIFISALGSSADWRTLRRLGVNGVSNMMACCSNSICDILGHFSVVPLARESLACRSVYNTCMPGRSRSAVFC